MAWLHQQLRFYRVFAFVNSFSVGGRRFLAQLTRYFTFECIFATIHQRNKMLPDLRSFVSGKTKRTFSNIH